MEDRLEHYHMYDYRARCAFAVTTEVTRELQRRHGLDPLTTIAAGRAVGCAALLASTLKLGEEYVHAAFQSEALISRVVAECNGNGHCRGYVSPARIEERLQEGQPVPASVGEALGDEGLLVVTRGVPGQEPYRAISKLVNGEIASDFARFLTDSEQIPSAVAAGVKLDGQGQVVAAGAVLVQKLAGTDLDDAALAGIERRMTQGLLLTERLAHGETPDEIVAFLQAGEGGYGLLTTRPLTFRCSCSRERMANALVALGEDDLRRIRDERGALEARCQYCADVQSFRLEELTLH